MNMAVFRPLHPFRPQAHIVAWNCVPRPAPPHCAQAVPGRRFASPLHAAWPAKEEGVSGQAAVFYVFPNSASPEPETPSGYVVVGGADYVTYASIQFTRNVLTLYATDASGNIHGYYSTRGGTELMLAEEEDLEDAP